MCIVSDFRHKHGLTQAEIAEEFEVFGISSDMVARWERGILPVPKWVGRLLMALSNIKILVDQYEQAKQAEQDAQLELNDAQAELADAQLASAQLKPNDAWLKFNHARREINAARREINAAQAKIDDARIQMKILKSMMSKEISKNSRLKKIFVLEIGNDYDTSIRTAIA